MQRQSSLVSQSSRRDQLNSPDSKLHAKSIGCMSGILHFISKYQSRRKKLITLGKCDQAATQANEDALGTTNPSSKFETEGKAINDNQLRIRSSLEIIPRSPTIPADIRCRSPEGPRKPPKAVLLARLMGLEGISKTMKPDQMPSDDQTAVEKRRKLLGALEKCDQDLKALKKIIEAVRSVESLQYSPMPSITPVTISQKPVVDKGNPVSVLDDQHLISWEHSSDHVSNNGICFRRHAQYGRVQTHLQRSQQEVCMMKKKLPIKENDLFNLNMLERTLWISSHDDQYFSSSSLLSYDDDHQMWCISKMAMMESVNEVCRDIVWGEKREIGRIGFALHDHICRDLVEDLVKELLHLGALNGCFCSTSSSSSSSYSSYYDCSSLPFEACRRRLTF